MTWSDFDTNTALERDVLIRAVPLIPTENDGSIRYTVDLAADSVGIEVAVGGVLGATPGSCVEMLGLRPLLTGTAWKVLDLLVEAAIEVTGITPAGSRGWKIEEKVKHARNGIRRPPCFDQVHWTALLRTYVGTEQLRHSLVHRTVHIDPSNALVGVDANGSQLRPFACIEQEALVRASLRAALLILSPVPDARMRNDLLRHLCNLIGVHGVSLPKPMPPGSIPEITVLIDSDPDAPDHFVVDVPALKAKLASKEIREADLVVVPRGRQEQELHGRWEDAPDEIVQIDAKHPPPWLA
jgi:hypothetical protein